MVSESSSFADARTETLIESFSAIFRALTRAEAARSKRKAAASSLQVDESQSRTRKTSVERRTKEVDGIRAVSGKVLNGKTSSRLLSENAAA